jgi:SSS family solute:Na+ symporter
MIEILNANQGSMQLAALDYAIIVFYLGLMLAIGAFLFTKIRRFKDYFLAGGTLTTPLLVCSLVSTYYELDVTFATSELGFDVGLASWFWWSRPYYLAILIAAFVVAKRLKQGDFMTLPDVLGAHYGQKARVAGAFACFFYCLPITAIAGLMAMFSAMGWPLEISLAVSMGVCATYTLSGGLLADTFTDTVQFLLMCVSVAIAIPLALKVVGGFDFTRLLPAAHMTPTGEISPWLLLAWGIGALTVFVEPAFYQRIFAARDQKTVTRALIIGVFLWAAYDWGVTLLGMMARAAVESGALPSGIEGREALMSLCLLVLPVGLKGLFVAGVLAAAMSSVDSYSLLASANFSYDIYRPIFKPDISEAALTRLTRFGVFIVILAGVLASLAFQKISDAWIFMESILVSVVFVPVAGVLFGRPRRAAGAAATVAGLASLIIFYVLIYALGSYDPEEESYVILIGQAEIWREYAMLFTLPISAASFFIAGAMAKK